MIRFEQASVTYPGGVTAMKNVDLQIDDGEFVVVVGLSGAGKSTLIRAINGLVPLTSGKLDVNGFDVPSLSRKGRRELIIPWKLRLLLALNLLHPRLAESIILGAVRKQDR